MNIKEISSNSLSFIGDAIYTLKVREFFITNKYQSNKSLQKLCNGYNCARGQTKVFNKLLNKQFFNNQELEIFKRGRNHINHIPKNGDRISYETASGLEAVCGFLYLTDKKRLNDFFNEVFKGGINNE